MSTQRRCFPLALLSLWFALPLAARAATLSVPTQYATIQAGIDASQDGDTVLVSDGTYTGTGNRDIDFGGKNVTVKSIHGAAKTIIDCQGTASASHRGFYIHSTETNAVIEGFTVKNAYEAYVQGVLNASYGGGICIAGSGGGQHQRHPLYPERQHGGSIGRRHLHFQQREG